MVWSYARPVGP